MAHLLIWVDDMNYIKMALFFSCLSQSGCAGLICIADHLKETNQNIDEVCHGGNQKGQPILPIHSVYD